MVEEFDHLGAVVSWDAWARARTWFTGSTTQPASPDSTRAPGTVIAGAMYMQGSPCRAASERIEGLRILKSSLASQLSQAESVLRQLRMLHTADEFGDCCVGCRRPWPCDTFVLLDGGSR